MGCGAAGGLPSPEPCARAQRLIANPLGSGSHWLGHPPPHRRSRVPQLASPRPASSPGPPPAKLPRQRGNRVGMDFCKGVGSDRAGDPTEALLPASAWHPIFGGGGVMWGWKDADVGKPNSPSTLYSLHPN